ncbi:hypothetical protein BZG36_01126 [Bifiguratus adelaidae]|uniref:Phosphatidylinositol 4-kinase n=1 Tax=Bifiguratus adelaidae TaxID=1938954 RepID=A0A261Y5Y4_9FUNG|nr:hypothetical protein BZG36_01126 [Bifiguratus adelaidae]
MGPRHGYKPLSTEDEDRGNPLYTREESPGQEQWHAFDDGVRSTARPRLLQSLSSNIKAPLGRLRRRSSSPVAAPFVYVPSENTDDPSTQIPSEVVLEIQAGITEGNLFNGADPGDDNEPYYPQQGFSNRDLSNASPGTKLAKSEWQVIQKKTRDGKRTEKFAEIARKVLGVPELEGGATILGSVFVPWGHGARNRRKGKGSTCPKSPYTTSERFNDLVESVRTAINNNIHPLRISQGSSGSYFCRDLDGKIVGVFKPKNEEPYGHLNPKWAKWIHRNLFPCFFGRSCLIPNLGYISESAASLLDARLELHIVPPTHIVELSSKSFHYDYFDRQAFKMKHRPLPPKMGSFQVFLEGYRDASVFLRDFPWHDRDHDLATEERRTQALFGCFTGPVSDNEANGGMIRQDVLERVHAAADANAAINHDSEGTNGKETSAYAPRTMAVNEVDGTGEFLKQDEEFRWTKSMRISFREQFEKLVILDYLMRNTDRGADNWMIRLCKEDDAVQPHLHVAAIDNGLAFPYKHPDAWRSYPYGWLYLPTSLILPAFSQGTRDTILPLLSSPIWWRETIAQLRQLFETDPDFDERMFLRQVAVLKGQGWNLVQTLKDPKAGPLDLVARDRYVVWEEEVTVQINNSMHMDNLARDARMASSARPRANTVGVTDNNSHPSPEAPLPSVPETSERSNTLLASSPKSADLLDSLYQSVDSILTAKTDHSVEYGERANTVNHSDQPSVALSKSMTLPDRSSAQLGPSNDAPKQPSPQRMLSSPSITPKIRRGLKSFRRRLSLDSHDRHFYAVPNARKIKVVVERVMRVKSKRPWFTGC